MRDVVVIVIGAVAALHLAALEPWWGFIVAFVVGHFFLSCNVVRMARPYELAWAAVFLAAASATLTGSPGSPATIGLALAVTLVVVVLQMRRPSYDGVLWQRVNPGLPEWWEQNR